ncbi:MAG TPA: SLC13 family permease [Bradyrhizobium sp.]|nr:SLC13 family permease [Bradyrhizobium sp.]
MSAEEIYRSIDWSIVVLLAAMIPVGQSFETSGTAAIVAEALGHVLAGAPPVGALAALCALTLLLSIFLNNVATAIIMGPLALDAAALIGLGPDAALLAVLIGASSDFLTPSATRIICWSWGRAVIASPIMPDRAQYYPCWSSGLQQPFWLWCERLGKLSAGGASRSCRVKSQARCWTRPDADECPRTSSDDVPPEM